MSKWVNHSYFWADRSFPHFWAKNEWFARKTDEQIPSPAANPSWVGGRRPGAAAQQTLAELVEGVRAGGEGGGLSNPCWVIGATAQQILAELVERVVERHSQAVLTLRVERVHSATHQLWWARLRAKPVLSPEICLLNNTVELSTSRASVVLPWRLGWPAERHHIVQLSTNRADSLCKSLYLVQHFIVRLYVKQLP